MFSISTCVPREVGGEHCATATTYLNEVRGKELLFDSRLKDFACHCHTNFKVCSCMGVGWCGGTLKNWNLGG